MIKIGDYIKFYQPEIHDLIVRDFKKFSLFYLVESIILNLFNGKEPGLWR